MRLSGALFFVWDVSWPFVMPVPDGRAFAPIILPGAHQAVSYHVVTGGHCWAALVGGTPIRLDAGDILLIPHGAAYVMGSSTRACARATVDLSTALGFYRQMASGDLPFVVVDGGGGPTTTHVVCGFLGCDVRPFNPLLSALPRLVRLPAPAEPAQDALQSLVQLAVAESRAPQPGSRSVLHRLSELMFIEVLRRCLRDLPDAPTGWLAALRDPLVGKALALLHRSPAEAWTLQRLARAAGTSRSRLAASFAQLVGHPPMQYLARWRMQMAAGLLAERSAKVATVAHEVGYASEAAFSRAFKRTVGVSPTEWRAQAAP